MKLHRGIVQPILFLIAPLVLSSALTSFPGQAATLSLSEGMLNFSNFSQGPQSTNSSTNTNTFASAPNPLDTAFANSTAEANFISAPFASASNNAASLAFGQGNTYSGLAQSQAQNLGTFNIGANQSLSFNFESSLFLQAVADNPSLESANSTGNLSFVVSDSTSQNIYGAFGLSGNLATQNNDDFLNLQGDNIALGSAPVLQSLVGGNQESEQASVNGSFNYFFNQPTSVTLSAFTDNLANVQAIPENPNPIAFVLFGLLGIALKAWKQSRLRG